MSATRPEYPMDPGERLDFGLDWSAVLDADGDALASSTWSITTEIGDPGLAFVAAKGGANGSFEGAVAAVWVEAPAPGARYALTNAVTTDAGRRHERSLVVVGEEL